MLPPKEQDAVVDAMNDALARADAAAERDRADRGALAGLLARVGDDREGGGSVLPRGLPDAEVYRQVRENGGRITRELKLTMFGPGPWIDEPDHAHREGADGFGRFVRRVPTLGNLCGYLALPDEHPWAGRHYDDIRADVHGGLTFSESGRELCEPTDARWHIGFDCAHGFDFIPTMSRYSLSIYESMRGDPGVPDIAYRDLAYVEAEIESLAEQASRVASWREYRDRLAAATSSRDKRRAAVFLGLAKRLTTKHDEHRTKRGRMRRRVLGYGRYRSNEAKLYRDGVR